MEIGYPFGFGGGMRHVFGLGLALIGCEGDERSREPVGTEPTSDTAPPTGVDTDGPVDTSLPTAPANECIAEQELGTGAMWGAWRSPSGTLYAVADGSPRVRAPDGTWSIDVGVRGFADVIDGVDDAEVWAISREAVFVRDAAGTWSDAGLPEVTLDLAGLAVAGPDDVRVLKVEVADCDYCASRSTPTVWSWDGATWTDEVWPEREGSIDGFALLPDGTPVISGSAGIVALTTPPDAVPGGGGATRSIAVGDDGTIVAFGETVAIGTVAGVVQNDPGLYVNEWEAAWVGGADDVWVSGTWWELGVVPHGVVAHWDGSAWTEVVSDTSGLSAITGGDGEVFAVGGYDHELVLHGDAGGLDVDRETWGIGWVRDLAVDVARGEAWGLGYGSLAVWSGGSWAGVPLDPAIDADRFAATDGRVVLVDLFEALHVVEGGVVEATPVGESDFYYAVAGADGVLFAFGTVSGEGPAAEGLLGMKEAGAGWEPIDMSTFPAGGEPNVAWADAADDVTVGAEVGDHGALVHWDGATWTVLTELPASPGWMARLSDGLLYFDADSLWSWDGATAAPVEGLPPQVRAAALLPDGTWYVSLVSVAPTADEDLYGHVATGVPGGTWTDVLTYDYVLPLAGLGTTVWSADDDTTWTRTECAR